MANDTRVIAIDAMGGDLAPAAVCDSLSLLTDLKCHFLVFGDQKRLQDFRFDSRLSYEIRHTEIVVSPDMGVSELRSARKSSIGLALSAVQSGEAHAVVSSGNTGVYLALAKIMLKTIDGIDRPALATKIPGREGSTFCLDLGANAECTVKNLVDFAILGEALANAALGKDDIKVALLNVGTEEMKGNVLVKETAKILKRILPNYYGFVEGNDICKGNVDVIVTDGFTGNVALKAIEGTAKFIVEEVKSAVKNSAVAIMGALMAKPALSKLKSRFDPRLHNGAIFAGLNGLVVKSHGNSDAIGFANAVRFTYDLLNSNMLERIRENALKSQQHYQQFYGEMMP